MIMSFVCNSVQFSTIFIRDETATIRITWLVNWLLEMEADLADEGELQPSLSQTQNSIFISFNGLVFFVQALSLICNRSLAAFMEHECVKTPSVVTVWHLSIGPIPCSFGQSINCGSICLLPSKPPI